MRATRLITTACVVLSVASIAAAEAQLNTATIERLTGAKGQMSEKEGVFKVTLPRADLHVTAAGVKLNPAMGLACWAAFKNVGDHTVVMGDQCLLEDQVNPVMSVALENGLEVTALHNHFFGDSPKVYFMHIGGMGDPQKLAGAVGRVFSKIKETAGARGETVDTGIDAAQSRIDGAPIAAILGQKGQDTKGVYKVTIGRSTRMAGHEMGNAMGVNTWAAFAGTNEKAVVDGDFAMTEQELQNVLKALRGNGINIVAIHNHMTGENPRIMFLHYWGVGAAEQLARGIKSALDTQQSHGAR